jgi:hypothetical protein
MNEATMTTTALHPVDDFARAVRTALADLPPDEVEDLTDGLEADLAERASDQESPEFGDPVAYANELRSAAGLPPRDLRRASSSMGSVFGSAWADLLSGLRELHKHPLIARLAAFFVAIRPLWWLFRAWVFYGIVTWAFGISALSFNLGTIVLGTACLVLSVQLGRGKWQPRAWLRTGVLVLNVLLVLTIPVALLATSFAFSSQYSEAYADGVSDSSQDANGLVYNGHPITNIFAYDAAGKPLTSVQLFDQKGRPLDTVSDTSLAVTDPPYLVPNKNVVGRKGWNVYPLETIGADQVGGINGLPKKGVKPKPATPTFLIVPPLANSTPTATATPVPTVTPTPVPTP